MEEPTVRFASNHLPIKESSDGKSCGDVAVSKSMKTNLVGVGDKRIFHSSPNIGSVSPAVTRLATRKSTSNGKEKALKLTTRSTIFEQVCTSYHKVIGKNFELLIVHIRLMTFTS